MARRSLLLAAVGLAVLAACQSPSAGYRSEETDPDVRLLALMDAYRGVEPPEPGATDVVAYIDAANAERAGFAQHVERQFALAVPFQRVRRDAVGCKGAGHVLDGALVLVQVELGHLLFFVPSCHVFAWTFHKARAGGKGKAADRLSPLSIARSGR